eukprot:3335339-Amphidinium_carterae.1
MAAWQQGIISGGQTSSNKGAAQLIAEQSPEFEPESVVESAVSLRDRWQRITKRRTTLAGRAASFLAEDMAVFHIWQRDRNAQQQGSATVEQAASMARRQMPKQGTNPEGRWPTMARCVRDVFGRVGSFPSPLGEVEQQTSLGSLTVELRFLLDNFGPSPAVQAKRASARSSIEPSRLASWRRGKQRVFVFVNASRRLLNAFSALHFEFAGSETPATTFLEPQLEQLEDGELVAPPLNE